MFTGTLGTPQSQPGQVQPGYFCTGVAVWRGPFPTQIAFLSYGNANQLVYPPGFTFTGLAPTVASSLAAGDPTWWEMH